MILTTPPSAATDVEVCDGQAPTQQQIIKLGDQLAMQVDAAVAKLVGHKVAPCSYYAEARQIDDAHWRITTYWRPDPRQGVELLGGPCDGAQIPWHADPKTGAPVTPLWAIPQIGGDEPGDLQLPGALAYHAHGINVEFGRWVYAVEGWKGAK